jgi:hypothetical protein
MMTSAIWVAKGYEATRLPLAYKISTSFRFCSYARCSLAYLVLRAYDDYVSPKFCMSPAITSNMYTHQLLRTEHLGFSQRKGKGGWKVGFQSLCSLDESCESDLSDVVLSTSRLPLLFVSELSRISHTQHYSIFPFPTRMP